VTLVINVDLTAQRLTVRENGVDKHVWPISSGRYGYATKTGTFKPQWLARRWYSRQYDYSPMPHAIFFNRGTAFHGTSYVGALGRPASHGCIRLAPGHAAQLFKLVQKHGLDGTRIVVRGAPKFHDRAIAGRRRDGSRRYADSRPPGAYGFSSVGPYGARFGLRGWRTVSPYREPRGSWPFMQ
jgi:hypothetical protein